MAAETVTSDQAAATALVYKPSGAGLVANSRGAYAIAANVEDGDIFEMSKLPADAVVFMGHLFAPDIDSNATETLDMDIGWAANGTEVADPDGFGNLGVLTGDAVAGIKPEVGISMPYGGVLISTGSQPFSAETTIQVEANAAAATFAAGTLTTNTLFSVP